MGGVVLGLVLGFAGVVGTVFLVVLPLMRAHDDSQARAQVRALKMAAAGGQLAGGSAAALPAVESVYVDEAPAPRRVAARRVDELPPTDAVRDAYEAPHPGVMLPRQAPAPAREFGGW